MKTYYAYKCRLPKDDWQYLCISAVGNSSPMGGSVQGATLFNSPELASEALARARSKNASFFQGVELRMTKMQIKETDIFCGGTLAFESIGGMLVRQENDGLLHGRCMKCKAHVALENARRICQEPTL